MCNVVSLGRLRDTQLALGPKIKKETFESIVGNETYAQKCGSDDFTNKIS